MKTRTCFTLNKETLIKLKLLSINEEVSMGEVIRRAISEYLEKHNEKAHAK